MAGFIVKPTVGNIPEIADGLVDARFDGMRETVHPDWAGTNKFGKPDNGDRWAFDFGILDEDGNTVYDPNSEGDPLTLFEEVNRFTGDRSAAWTRFFKGLLTPAEKALFPTEGWDYEQGVGRIVQLEITHNEKGYPHIEQVIAGRKDLISKLAKAAK